MKRLSVSHTSRATLHCLMVALAGAIALLPTFAHAQILGTEKVYNWEDKEFAPDELNGAVHLRLGLAGKAPGLSLTPRTVIARGNPSCDLVYLYWGRSGRKFPQEIKEECALNEYELAHLFTSDTMASLNNAFTRQSALSQYLPEVERRTAALSKARRFYVRTPVRIAKVDPATSVVDLDFELNDNHWMAGLGQSVMFNSGEGALGSYQPLQRIPTNLGRGLEDARLGSLTNGAEVYFDVSGVGSADPNTGVGYVINISNVKYKVYYYLKTGELATIATF